MATLDLFFADMAIADVALDLATRRGRHLAVGTGGHGPCQGTVAMSGVTDILSIPLARAE
ncbi:hypothetical protein ONA70_34105 [Micromonospora yasonensis]|uniref:hypothetical protein n=1 Tax=Micromonospora yasonensis TaxID=1128667 RepID=UPI00222F7391|nr:hypothetical protein [Micromonospora yasonensis]MCW3845113.1 hypothetical protein [Micromonospora yasonensis]